MSFHFQRRLRTTSPLNVHIKVTDHEPDYLYITLPASINNTKYSRRKRNIRHWWIERHQGTALFVLLIQPQFGKWILRRTYTDRYVIDCCTQSPKPVSPWREIINITTERTCKLDKSDKGAGLRSTVRPRCRICFYNSDIFLYVLGAENKTTAGHSPLPWKHIRPHSRSSLVFWSLSYAQYTESHTIIFL